MGSRLHKLVTYDVSHGEMQGYCLARQSKFDKVCFYYKEETDSLLVHVHKINLSHILSNNIMKTLLNVTCKIQSLSYRYLCGDSIATDKRGYPHNIFLISP